jgi:hypothetical protein
VAALTAVAPATWHRHLGHPSPDTLYSLSRSSFINCTSNKSCLPVGKHIRLPFSSSSNRVAKAFHLIHLDLWTSPVISVSGFKYYLIILDDFSHYLWTFPLKLKSYTFTTLSNFFAYVATQFSSTVKAIQCDNGVSLTTLPPRPFFCRKGYILGCCVLTRPLRMVKQNALFAPLIVSSACFLSRLPSRVPHI